METYLLIIAIRCDHLDFQLLEIFETRLRVEILTVNTITNSMFYSILQTNGGNLKS